MKPLVTTSPRLSPPQSDLGGIERRTIVTHVVDGVRKTSTLEERPRQSSPVEGSLSVSFLGIILHIL